MKEDTRGFLPYETMWSSTPCTANAAPKFSNFPWHVKTRVNGRTFEKNIWVGIVLWHLFSYVLSRECKASAHVGRLVWGGTASLLKVV